MEVHNPYRPPRNFWSEFVTAKGKDRYVNAIPDPAKRPNEDDIRFMIGLYDGEIRGFDDRLEELTAQLRVLGLLETTGTHPTIWRLPDRESTPQSRTPEWYQPVRSRPRSDTADRCLGYPWESETQRRA